MMYRFFSFINENKIASGAAAALVAAFILYLINLLIIAVSEISFWEVVSILLSGIVAVLVFNIPVPVYLVFVGLAVVFLVNYIRKKIDSQPDRMVKTLNEERILDSEVGSFTFRDLAFFLLNKPVKTYKGKESNLHEMFIATCEDFNAGASDIDGDSNYTVYLADTLAPKFENYELVHRNEEQMYLTTPVGKKYFEVYHKFCLIYKGKNNIDAILRDKVS